jgi:hypothetical protein
LRNVSCLVSLVCAVACGGDKSGDRTDGSGGSGTSGSGGSGTGGSTANGTGGSGSANGGSGGLMAFTCEAKEVTLPDLTGAIDSNGKWGSSSNLNGGSFTYGDADGDGNVDITVTYATNEVHITGTVGTYTGYGMWFGGIGNQAVPCANASKYQGLSFEVVNNGATPPNINVQVQVHDDSPADGTNKRGGCVYSSEDKKYTDCVYPNTAVALPSDGSAIEVPWSMFGGGKPVSDAQEGKALDGLQWDFWKEGATPYEIDIVIKNIKFYGP